MPALHITKPAVGCRSLADLKQRQAARATNGRVFITTRYRPKRHKELIGGSLYWILKHRLIARQEILNFEEADDGRWNIWLSDTLIAVRTRPKRVHQGWRYLRGEDAPADLGDDADGLSGMPTKMLSELSRLALI